MCVYENNGVLYLDYEVVANAFETTVLNKYLDRVLNIACINSRSQLRLLVLLKIAFLIKILYSSV